MDFMELAHFIYEIYSGRSEIKPFQYESILEQASFELKCCKEIQSRLGISYGTVRYIISRLLEKEFLEISRKTRGGKEWYARTYKDALALVYDQLHSHIERRMREKKLAEEEAEMVKQHCNLTFKALFEQIEAIPLELRWKALALAGLDLMLEKRLSNSYGLPKLCICPHGISSKCEECSLKSYFIDYALNKYLNPFSGVKKVPVAKEVKLMKKLIDPKPASELMKYANKLKQDFNLIWECVKLFYTTDELFLNGKLNVEVYERKILSNFRRIISPI
ncbi:MAG: hypothetical protein QXJ68_02315 [Methanocellales archaeon]